MKLQKAIRIQKILSEKYLFANIAKPQYAGTEDDYGLDDDIDEDMYMSFQAIDAIGIVKRNNNEFALQLFNTSFVLYPESISRFFHIKDEDVRFQEIEPFSFQSRFRPLQIGCSVGHLLSDNYGTLGCFVCNEEGECFLLSNYHVLYNPASEYGDDFVIQPGNPGGCRTDSVGLVASKITLDSSAVNQFDAALAGPISTDIDSKIPYFNNARVSGVTEADYGLSVYKIGASTGLTHGEVKSLPTDVKINFGGIEYGFKDQILIEGMGSDNQSSAVFSEPGDSGSLVINSEDHKAVGLLFAGSSSGLSLANPINGVLTSLCVSIVS